MINLITLRMSERMKKKKKSKSRNDEEKLHTLHDNYKELSQRT